MSDLLQLYLFLVTLGIFLLGLMLMNKLAALEQRMGMFLAELAKLRARAAEKTAPAALPAKTPAPPPAKADPPAPVARQVYPPSPPSPREAAPSPKLAAESRFESTAVAVWDWLTVGETWRPKSLPSEYAVGAVQLLRGAMLLLLVGIGFGVKYIHEAGLFPPQYRLIAGGLAAAALTVSGMRLLKHEYRLLGLGLAGLGIALGYFLAFAGVQLYGLIDAPAAFGIAGSVSFLAALLAVKHDSQLLAIIGFAGGYAAPLLFHTNYADAAKLFRWLLLFAAAAVPILTLRRWPIAACLLFAGTYGYAAALTRYELETVVHLPFAFALLTTAFAGYVFRSRKPATPLDIFLLILNAATALLLLFPSARELAIGAGTPKAVALVPLAMGAFYTAALAVFRLAKQRDARIQLTFATTSAALLAIAAGFYFESGPLVAVWSLFSLALLACGTRLGARTLVATGALLLSAAGIALAVYANSHAFAQDFFSRRAATYGMYCAALFGAAWLFRGKNTAAERFYAVLALATTFCYTSAEWHFCLSRHWPDFRGGLSVWWGVFALALLLAGLLKGVRPLRVAALVLFAVTGGKILLVDLAGQPTVCRIAGLAAVGLAMLAGAYLYLHTAKKLARDVEKTPPEC